eukprot:490064_1
MGVFTISAIILVISISPALGAELSDADHLQPISDCVKAGEVKTFDKEYVDLNIDHKFGPRCDNEKNTSTSCAIRCKSFSREFDEFDEYTLLKAYVPVSKQMLNRGPPYNTNEGVSAAVEVECINNKFVMRSTKCLEVCVIPKLMMTQAKCNAFLWENEPSEELFHVAFHGTSCTFVIRGQPRNLICSRGVWLFGDRDVEAGLRSMDLSPVEHLIETVSLERKKGMRRIALNLKIHHSLGLNLWVTADSSVETMTSAQLRKHP